MRTMGWCWDDLMEAPADVVDEIAEVLIEEAEELERIRDARAKGIKTPPRRGRVRDDDQPDPKERVQTVTKSGLVVEHRPIAEADALMWALTGKRPKSWKGKV